MGRHLDLREDLAHLHQVQIAGRGQLQAPAYPAKQQVLQEFFQLRDLLADRALGQVQFLGGAGEAQVPGDGLETLQGGDRGQVAFVQHRGFLVLVSAAQHE